ncbi:MAG: hypothetical protein ACRBBQ_14900 [Cognatishimia sp.]
MDAALQFSPDITKIPKRRSNLFGKHMAFIKTKLTRIIDSSFPTFGEFDFVDALGEVIVIHEKLPVLGVEIPIAESTFPIEVKIECAVISRTEVGVLIDIKKPHDLADVHGRTRFQLNADKLIE